MSSPPKIIKGLRGCGEYLTGIGMSVTPSTLKKYIEAGLPCWFKFGTYHFHTEVIDEYFKVMCRQQTKDAPDEVENGN